MDEYEAGYESESYRNGRRVLSQMCDHMERVEPSVSRREMRSGWQIINSVRSLLGDYDPQITISPSQPLSRTPIKMVRRRK